GPRVYNNRNCGRDLAAQKAPIAFKLHLEYGGSCAVQDDVIRLQSVRDFKNKVVCLANKGLNGDFRQYSAKPLCKGVGLTCPNVFRQIILSGEQAGLHDRIVHQMEEAGIGSCDRLSDPGTKSPATKNQNFFPLNHAARVPESRLTTISSRSSITRHQAICVPWKMAKILSARSFRSVRISFVS